MNKIIITHSGQFHCDELTAIALLQVFTNDTYIIQRIAHQDPIPVDADYVIDVGRIHNPAKGLFDHHQYEGGKSSAGLIWEHIGLEDTYSSITSIVNLIDENDVGIRKASPFELPSIIASFNTEDVYNDEEQILSFFDALFMLRTYFKSAKDYQDKLIATEATLIALYDSRSADEIKHNYMVAPHYLVGWQKFLNGETTPDIRCLIWPKSETEPTYQGQVIPIKSGEYGLHGARFELDPSMVFVHANGFFCVAPDKATILTYLTK